MGDVVVPAQRRGPSAWTTRGQVEPAGPGTMSVARPGRTHHRANSALTSPPTAVTDVLGHATATQRAVARIALALIVTQSSSRWKLALFPPSGVMLRPSRTAILSATSCQLFQVMPPVVVIPGVFVELVTE
jgi:hypothetical protein